MAGRLGSSPSSAGFAVTSLLTMGQSLDLWAFPVPLSLGLLTPHLEGPDVCCPLHTHFAQEHSGPPPQKQEP